MIKIPFLPQSVLIIIIWFASNCVETAVDNQVEHTENTLQKQSAEHTEYESHTIQTSKEKKIADVKCTHGFERVVVEPKSFAEYLRNLKLKTDNNTVYLYNGNPKRNQSAQYAVLTIDVGTKDLQQCADAIMRLRAEYLFGQKRYNEIHFNFTSGHKAEYTKYADGYRAVVKGNKVSWVKKAKRDTSYKCFRKYMELVFNYAGTWSLQKEMKKVGKIEDMQIGDVFIYGGFPGHAVMVADMAENKTSGEKLFLLIQSYMPAQEIHILKNPKNTGLSPWYSTQFTGELITPEWTFSKESLKRF